MSDIKQLLLDGKINKFEYDSYVLFVLDEMGRIYLSNAIESILLEPSEGMQIEHTYAWHDGRRSVWREIKLAIVKITQLMKESDNDRRSTEPDNNYNQYRFDYTASIPFGDRNK